VRRFVEREIAPHVDEWEVAREFPRDLFQRCGELGFLGLKFPEAYGGQGGSYLHDAVWTEELSRSGGSGGVAAGINGHIGIALPPIFHFGTEEQRRRWIVPGIRGEKIGALGITEPGAGSDVASIRTSARRENGYYVVNGAKTFITNGVRADFLVCAAKTTQEGGHHGMSFFIVDTDQPGYQASKLEKMGWHASDTGDIALDDVFVPEQNLLGGENQGFYLIMANFQWERLAMALGAVGAMRLAYEKTAQFCRERQTFGRPLTKHQVVRHKLVDIATTAYNARCITYDALRRFVNGEEPVQQVTMAKLATQRACFDVMDACLQLHGGAGYMREYGIERAARDARLGPIGGGSDEIMREILGRTLAL
jgi:acyl-CoA dehydrogenase